MMVRLGRWHFESRTPLLCYCLAVLLAAAAQAARIPLHPQTRIPFITYVPFLVVSAAVGGFGPGLLTTAICVLESMYFATEPLGSFTVGDPHLWDGLVVLAFTGLASSLLFELLNRAWRAKAAAAAAQAAHFARERETRQKMLESIIQNSPVAIALLRGPEFIFSMVNPAYQALVPGEPLIGRTVASVWAPAAPLFLPLLEVARNTQTAHKATGFAIPAVRGPEGAVEEIYFDFSYVPLAGAEDEVLVVAVEITERMRAEIDLRAAYSHLAAIYANAPLTFLVVDEQFQVGEANNLAARFTGQEVAAQSNLRPGDALGCLNALVDPLGCGHGPSCGHCALRLAIVDTLNSGIPHDAIEAWLPQSVAGIRQQRCLMASTTVMNSDLSTKVLVCAQDITERKHSEEELAHQRDELQRQFALINLSHDAIVTTDANRVIRGWNRGAEEMYGWTEAEAMGHVLHTLLGTSSSLCPVIVDEFLTREQQWEGELERSHRNNARILVESRQVILRDISGADTRILVIERDITARRRAEDALKQTVRQVEASLAEKTVLLQEIHHRVKNNLAVTASLLSMQAEGCAPEAKLALEASQQRVHSIALVHEHLYGNEHLDRINFGEYTRELVQGVYSALSGEGRHIRVELQLDPIELSIQRSVPCALILNELLSNAFKYAFADGRTGRILVSFRQPEPGCCELAVEDDGVGLPPGILGGRNKSLGLRIVGILTTQLDGSIEQQACRGTRIVLRFPSAA